jgi:AraC-like DNA-binding protein
MNSNLTDFRQPTIGCKTATQSRRGAASVPRGRAIISDIIANLSDCDLTVAAVAQRQGVTPRYLHKLFEGEELTFSTFVLGQRVARPHRTLCDPQYDDRSTQPSCWTVNVGLSGFQGPGSTRALAGHSWPPRPGRTPVPASRVSARAEWTAPIAAPFENAVSA